MQDHWQINMLGGLSAHQNDLAVTRFATAKVATLLARLAYFPRRTHPREELADLLWPDADLDSGRANLRQALASLRRQLEPPGIAPGSVLMADRFAVRLNPTTFATDVAAFEAALRASSRGGTPAQAQTLAHALALYQGDLLPGFYEDWVLTERERLRAAYESARRRHDELAACAGADASTPEPSPSAPSPSAPPTGDSQQPSACLPQRHTRFFGRERELADIGARLHDGECRLLTLTGLGGCGKTSLAVEVARQNSFAPDGLIQFVPLAETTDGSLLLRAVADALRLPRSDGDPLEQIAQAVSSFPRVLLVLDNMEQIAEAGALVLARMLARLPRLTCLVTSRQRLELAGEVEYPVPPLSVPADEQTPEEIWRSAGVRLFVNRAQLARPDFQLTPRNAGAVSALCRRLEGIPLALELAAAWAAVLTPSQMRTRLSERFDLLVSRHKEVLPRHRTLRATILWSYDLLPPDLQRFWSRLSVFRGGWTAEAAAAVCDEPQALFLLTQLRARSLIVMEDGGGEARFGMLETLREFAVEQLAGEERAALSARHAAYFLRFAEDAEPLLTGPDQILWLDRLEAEHDNFRAALGGPPGAGASLRLAGALWRFWFMRGHLREAQDRLTQGLACDDTRSLARGKALNAAGVMAYYRGQYPPARIFFEEALALRRDLGDTPGVSATLSNLGNLLSDMGDNTRARAILCEALSLNRQTGDPKATAATLTNLATLMIEAGEFDDARKVLEEALAIQRHAGNPWALSMILNNLAAVRRRRGDYTDARTLAQESLALSREMGYRSGEEQASSGLAAICRDEGDFAGARALYAEVIAIGQEVGEREGNVATLEGLGCLAVRQARWEQAARIWGAAEALRETLGAPLSDYERQEHAARVASLHDQVQGSRFAAAWAEGQGMTPPEAFAYALRATDPEAT